MLQNWEYNSSQHRASLISSHFSGAVSFPVFELIVGTFWSKLIGLLPTFLVLQPHFAFGLNHWRGNLHEILNGEKWKNPGESHNPKRRRADSGRNEYRVNADCEKPFQLLTVGYSRENNWEESKANRRTFCLEAVGNLAALEFLPLLFPSRSRRTRIRSTVPHTKYPSWVSYT